MTKSQLLKAYKNNGWITTKRNYAGSYTVKVGEYIFRVSSPEEMESNSGEWLVNTEEGCKDHNERDPYIMHSISLIQAQIDLVTMYS